MPPDDQRQARVLRAPRGSRLRRGRRFLHRSSSTRPIEHARLQAARRSDRQVHGGPEETQGSEEPVHLLYRRLPAVRADHRQRRGHAEGRVDREGPGQPEHLRSAAPTSKASFSSTSSTRSTSRPSPEFRRFPEDLDNMFVKNDSGQMVPYSSFMTIKKKQGLNEITRYNLYPSAAIQGAPAPGYSSGQAIQAIREVAAETLPTVTPRLGGPILRRVEKGERGGLYLPDRRRLRLSGAGRAVREFHPAAGRDPVAADRGLRFLLLPAGHGVGQRRLRPDRSDHAGRSARQERDPDRRIRGAAAPGGPAPPRGSHRRRKTALPADSDDLLRLHRRSPSAGRCHRRRGDRKPNHWHHGSRRDARGHRDRSLGDSRPLLLVRPDCRRAQTPPGRGG